MDQQDDHESDKYNKNHGYQHSTLLPLQLYSEQEARHWPSAGMHILAHYDDSTITVYQAYSDAIADGLLMSQNYHGDAAVQSGFSLERMTWIKTNFLWMMFRSGWGTKPEQTRTLAIRIRREGWEAILEASVSTRPSEEQQGCGALQGRGQADADARRQQQSHLQQQVENPEDGNEQQGENPVQPLRGQKQKRGQQSGQTKPGVRLQWDPDHLPDGSKHPARRAIQIGLRGEWVERVSRQWIAGIFDVTPLVVQQRGSIGDPIALMVPRERVYVIKDATLRQHVGVDAWEVACS